MNKGFLAAGPEKVVFCSWLSRLVVYPGSFLLVLSQPFIILGSVDPMMLMHVLVLGELGLCRYILPVGC